MRRIHGSSSSSQAVWLPVKIDKRWRAIGSMQLDRDPRTSNGAFSTFGAKINHQARHVKNRRFGTGSPHGRFDKNGRFCLYDALVGQLPGDRAKGRNSTALGESI
jgi:hypothetical protein